MTSTCLFKVYRKLAEAKPELVDDKQLLKAEEVFRNLRAKYGG